jgi:hypothetical protein
MLDKLVGDNLQALVDDHGEEFGFTRSCSFRDKGVLTKNFGLIVRDEEGEEHLFALLGSYDSE